MGKRVEKEGGSLLIWLVLGAGLAIAGYFAFKSFGAVDKQMPLVQEQVSKADVNIPEFKENTSVSTYIKPEYADQILFVTELKVLLIKGDNFNHVLDYINALSITDEKTRAGIESLRALGRVPEISTLLMQYDQVRSDITKAAYQEKYSKVPLLPWLLKKIIIHPRGERAINSGPPESNLEIAAQYISKRDLNEPYKQILALDDKYKSYAKEWLENSQKYLVAQTVIQNVFEHITSSEYKNKFTRKCTAIDKE